MLEFWLIASTSLPFGHNAILLHTRMKRIILE